MSNGWLTCFRQKRFQLMGLPVDPLTKPEIISLFETAIERNTNLTLANVNLHALYCSGKSAGMKAVLQASNSIVHIDGMPIVWLGKFYGLSLGGRHRNTPLDFLPELLRLCAARGWRVAFVGSAPGCEHENLAALRRIAPRLTATCIHGHAEAHEEGEMIARLNEFKPHFVLAGMGMPKQEEWISRNRARLSAPVIMAVGGFIDYFAHRTSMPPRLLGRLGLEWAWRLARDPKRLAFRYLVEPVIVAKRLLKRSA